KPKQDWNHAWGAAPANVLPRQLMGVQPLEPGFSKILIRPRPGSLAWAESKTPTPQGPINVRFEVEDGFRLHVEIPPKVNARVGLPVTSASGPSREVELTLDGRPASVVQSEECYFVENVRSGRHELHLRNLK